MSSLACSTLFLSMLLALAPSLANLEAQSDLNIGWAELDTSSLGPELSRLGVVLPKALMKATSFIGERSIPQRELSITGLKQASLATDKARNAVAAARRKRDLVSISVRDPAQRASELRNAQAALDKAAVELDKLLLLQSGLLEEDFFPLAILKAWKGHEDGSLLPSSGDPALVCSKNGLDLFVRGSIKPAGPFLLVELAVYSATLDEDLWMAAEYTARDDIDGLVGTLERPLASALAGRPFGRALLQVLPEISEILIDGKPIADNNPLFFSQGSHLMTVSAAGYHPVSTRFAIILGSDTMVEVKLEPVITSALFVESLPSGATIFLDGAPLGPAPFELPGANYPRILTARLDGFEDLNLVIRPGDSVSRVLMELQASDGSVYSDRFEEAKGKFYRSLGWFIISLPATVLSYGTFNTYQQRLETLPVSSQDQLSLYFYGSQSVFWVSAAASASLAANSIRNLVRYIKAAR